MPTKGVQEPARKARSHGMSKVSVAIWLIVLAAIAGVAAFIGRTEATRRFLGSDPDLFKLSYQFLLITVLGGAVAFLYKQLETRREMRRSLRQMYSELLSAYNKAKLVRRHLRAQLGTKGGVDPGAKISAQTYDDELEKLGDAQLTFEVYAKKAEDTSLWFAERAGISEPLRKIEGYLNDLLDEYEKKRKEFSKGTPERTIGDLDALTEFVGPYREATKFKEQFKYPMREALVALGGAVLR